MQTKHVALLTRPVCLLSHSMNMVVHFCQAMGVMAGSWVPQGDGGPDTPGWVQGPEEAEEDKESTQAPLLG